MATEVKRLIRVRVEKSASFKRDGFGKKRQLSDSWRKPRGQHNKQREQKKAKGALPTPGYGSPVAVRGMHPSGFFEVLVATLKELEGLDPKTLAVRIGATVGDRKRITIQEAAIAKGLKVLNARTVKAKAAKAPVKKADTTDADKKKAKKPVASKAPAKKAAAKPKSESAEKTEKKAPAKKAAAKPKSESAEKTEKKAPAKKAAAKPKSESAEKTEKKAPAKKAAAKITKSGVKKNE